MKQFLRDCANADVVVAVGLQGQDHLLTITGWFDQRHHAAADGELAPDVAKTLVDTLKSGAEIGTLQGLTQRLNDLENRLGSRSPVPVALPAVNHLQPDSDTAPTSPVMGTDSWSSYAPADEVAGNE